MKQNGNGQSEKNGGQTKQQPSEALEMLASQHREVEDLFEKLREVKSGDQRVEIFQKIGDLLAAHSKVEETMFYPAAVSGDTEMIVRQALEEHLAVKRIIADLLDMEGDDPQFLSKAIVLEEMVKHHVSEEESTLFPKIESQGIAKADELVGQMKKRFGELMDEEPRLEVPKETGAANLCF